jgi:diacylglycerol kinase
MKNKSIGESFKNAFSGIISAFAAERNMKIHGMAAVLAIFMGILLRIGKSGWIALIFAIGLVFICELFNTAIEILTDMITEQYSEKAKKVKDISAGAVLLGAVISVIIGAVVFLGPIIQLIR